MGKNKGKKHYSEKGVSETTKKAVEAGAKAPEFRPDQWIEGWDYLKPYEDLENSVIMRLLQRLKDMDLPWDKKSLATLSVHTINADAVADCVETVKKYCVRDYDGYMAFCNPGKDPENKALGIGRENQLAVGYVMLVGKLNSSMS